MSSHGQAPPALPARAMFDNCYSSIAHAILGPPVNSKPLPSLLKSTLGCPDEGNGTHPPPYEPNPPEYKTRYAFRPDHITNIHDSNAPAKPDPNSTTPPVPPPKPPPKYTKTLKETGPSQSDALTQREIQRRFDAQDPSFQMLSYFTRTPNQDTANELQYILYEVARMPILTKPLNKLVHLTGRFCLKTLNERYIVLSNIGWLLIAVPPGKGIPTLMPMFTTTDMDPRNNVYPERLTASAKKKPLKVKIIEELGQNENAAIRIRQLAEEQLAVFRRKMGKNMIEIEKLVQVPFDATIALAKTREEKIIEKGLKRFTDALIIGKEPEASLRRFMRDRRRYRSKVWTAPLHFLQEELSGLAAVQEEPTEPHDSDEPA
ncbi:hypothetical protein ABW21_db0200087 [Orbilia brochopaga]|nr:hypothetical protein ABW21_db0200087 [Drechslerella brochopaga]